MSVDNKNTVNKKKATSCGAIVHKLENKMTHVLLIKPFENRDVWGIPKGHVEKDETVEQCAIREVKEETGLDVVLGDKLQIVTTSNKKEDKEVHTFLATQTCNNVPSLCDPDEDIADIRWFNVDGMPTIHHYQTPVVYEAINKIRVIHDIMLGVGPVAEAVEFVRTYAFSVDSWIVLKKELLKDLNSETKAMFALRDPYTKKLNTNDLERAVAKRWTELTGNVVLFT